MKDNSYYNIDLIIGFLENEKVKHGDYIDGWSLNYFIAKYGGEISEKEVRKQRYKQLRSRMTMDIREACDLAGAETMEKENLVNRLDKIFSEMVE